MRFLLLLIPAMLYALDCGHPEAPAEKAVCANSELKARDQDIERQFAELKGKLTGENAAILADTGMPFLRQLNNCSNESEVQPCVAKVLLQRQELLSRAQRDPNAIHEAIAQAFFVDVGFVWKYWAQLAGRQVSVFGCLILDDASPRIHAVLEAENQHPAPMVFKSMTEEIADFLDDQKPCANWLVTVRKQGDKFVLYGEDVLGRPLP